MILIFWNRWVAELTYFYTTIRIFKSLFYHDFSKFTVRGKFLGAGLFVVVFRIIEKVFLILCYVKLAWTLENEFFRVASK